MQKSAGYYSKSMVFFFYTQFSLLRCVPKHKLTSITTQTDVDFRQSIERKKYIYIQIKKDYEN